MSQLLDRKKIELVALVTCAQPIACRYEDKNKLKD